MKIICNRVSELSVLDCFFCFLLRLFIVSLDCPFLIAPSVFSNVFITVSLDCPFLIVASVFSRVYFKIQSYPIASTSKGSTIFLQFSQVFELYMVHYTKNNNKRVILYFCFRAIHGNKICEFEIVRFDSNFILYISLKFPLLTHLHLTVKS